MTTIHMEIERVREIASQLDQLALEMFSKGQALKSVSYQVGSAWQGGDSGPYLQEFRNWLNNINAQAENLETIALQVVREVVEWEATDASFTLEFNASDVANRLNGAASLVGLGFGMGTISAAVVNLYRTGFMGDLGYADTVLGGLSTVGDALEFGGRAIGNWANPGYETLGEKAASLAYDGAFVATNYYVKSAVQDWAAEAAILPAASWALTLLPLGPVGVVGAVAIGVGAVAAYWGVGEAVGAGMDALYNWSAVSGFRDAIIHGNASEAVSIVGSGIADVAHSAADFVDDAFDSATHTVSSWFH